MLNHFVIAWGLSISVRFFQLLAIVNIFLGVYPKHGLQHLSWEQTKHFGYLTMKANHSQPKIRIFTRSKSWCPWCEPLCVSFHVSFLIPLPNKTTMHDAKKNRIWYNTMRDVKSSVSPSPPYLWVPNVGHYQCPPVEAHHDDHYLIIWTPKASEPLLHGSPAPYSCCCDSTFYFQQ